MIHGDEIRRTLDETYKQASAFLQMYGEKLKPQQIKLLSLYSRVPKMNKWNRMAISLKQGTLKHGISRKIGQLLFI
jgi:hypothetical protein